MCNLSWTPHSNLEKDNSLKTTPVLAQRWAVWSRVGWGIAPMGGAKRAPLILANLELCGSIWRSNDSLQHTKDLYTDEDVLI